MSHNNVLSSMVTCLGLPWWVAFTNSTIQEILVWSPVHLSTNQVCFRTQCYLSSVRYEPGCDFGSCCFCSCFCFLFLCFLLLCCWEKKNLKSHTLAADPATHHSLLVALPLKASLPRWLIRSWSHPQVKHNLVISTQIEKICSSIWIISAGMNVKQWCVKPPPCNIHATQGHLWSCLVIPCEREHIPIHVA